MSPDHSDQWRPVPRVQQPHRIDSRDEIPGSFEAYCLFLQLNKQLSTVTNRGKFLMAARPVNSMSYSEFLICGDLEDLTEQSEVYYGGLR
ncbi:hypothetical protein R1sor_024103 [Riccia sorocarpa]|uniref:Tubby C-terminal domain-containing protein n=1 Tax=Riccia sorocarpa TaxID=122646 RepID=A0ABD3GRR0_9MARC